MNLVPRSLMIPIPMLLVLIGSVAGAYGEELPTALDCTQCHICSTPTAEEPCLKVHEACPRHQHAALSADLGPDIVILDQLEDLYVPVRFNHRGHAQMTNMGGSCESCHHYTPPDQDHPECRECHPVDVADENLSQPGLKGAYHRNCLGCHREWDNDYTCEICHEKKEGGRLNGSATSYSIHDYRHTVIREELIVFKTEYDDGDEVPFHHARHVDVYGQACATCHREQSCLQCHVQGVASHPMGDLAEIDLHDTCWVCHSDNDDDCEQCHGRNSDDLFNHASTGWPMKSFHEGLACRQCHPGEGMITAREDSRCVACHPEGWKSDRFRHRMTGVVLDEEHGDLDCGDCHLEGLGSRAACDDCHDDGRVYNAATGFRPASD